MIIHDGIFRQWYNFSRDLIAHVNTHRVSETDYSMINDEFSKSMRSCDPYDRTNWAVPMLRQRLKMRIVQNWFEEHQKIFGDFSEEKRVEFLVGFNRLLSSKTGRMLDEIRATGGFDDIFDSDDYILPE
jgi:L-fucose isomerase-like protein